MLLHPGVIVAGVVVALILVRLSARSIRKTALLTIILPPVSMVLLFAVSVAGALEYSGLQIIGGFCLSWVVGAISGSALAVAWRERIARM